MNTSGKNGPMDQRDDYQEAKRTRERLYEEHGQGNTRIHSKDQVRQRRSQQFTGTDNKFFILKLASSFMVEIFIME